MVPDLQTQIFGDIPGSVCHEPFLPESRFLTSRTLHDPVADVGCRLILQAYGWRLAVGFDEKNLYETGTNTTMV